MMHTTRLLRSPIAAAIGLLVAAAAEASPQSAPVPRDTAAARVVSRAVSTLDSIAAVLRQPVSLPRDTVRDTVWLPSTLPAGTAARDAALVRQLDISIHRDSIRCRSLTTSTLQGRCNRAIARITAVRDSLRPSAPAPVPDPIPDPDPPPPPADSQPPAPPDTLPPVVVPPPSSGGAAELPRVWLSFPWPTATRTVNVAAGADLQAALNAAQRGDELVLAAGATWTGNFTLPTKPGSGWITVRSSALSQLPAIGTRVGPAHASLMPRIVTPNTAPAIATAAAASHWRLVGIEVTAATSVTAEQYGLVWLGNDTQSTLAQVPTDVVLDRVYVHGQLTTNMSRCVMLNSARTQVSDSYLDQCHGKGFDSQAIAGWNGPGPYRIVNSYLAGAGENVFFGGADPSISGLVPSDIEIRGNYVHTPASWRGVWSKKNLLEFKNAARILVEGNVFDGSWHDAQTGEAILIKSVNQDGGCRWCRTTDVTFRRNLLRNAGAGISIAGRPEQHPVDTAARRIVVSENVLDIGAVPGSRRAIILQAQASGVQFERNVIAGQVAGVYLEAGAPCTFQDNVWARGDYGVIGSGVGIGTPAVVLGCGASYTWTGMTFVGAANGVYPPGTTWVSSESQAPFAAQIRAIVQQATAGVVIP